MDRVLFVIFVDFSLPEPASKVGVCLCVRFNRFAIGPRRCKCRSFEKHKLGKQKKNSVTPNPVGIRFTVNMGFTQLPATDIWFYLVSSSDFACFTVKKTVKLGKDRLQLAKTR